ncbi:probable Aspartyl aminopeptidase 4 [Saccharomycodes ludwigii]|uniref:aspartyl aminopeptidase n=1 Tax=Saccharomycodes ludwigii TaxID=36035 RepID=A0A376B7E0_9ASCO|nr:hypothetical protein SCDLUD_003205 [Saccharomycodes ludwigii]KAH3900234.1 hypothetical protein SCDLUD_003205 [Saccharomycodes ludwigii]SSD60562.1 probable Aspartyl aminopeptidase 4 [Saccharomycodes ludwigii]
MSSTVTATKRNYPEEFIKFLNSSPTPFHAVYNIKKKLEAKGYKELSERETWNGSVKKSGKYYVTRNNSSIIAFQIGENWIPGNPIAITGAHTDSPVLKIKPISKRKSEGYLQVGVECYGGGIWHSWFDSDLSIAGRVMCKEQDGVTVSKLIDLKRPLLKIPTLAIHLDRTVNTKFEFNKETKLLPIIGLENEEEKSSADSSNNNGCCNSDTKLESSQFSSLQNIIERHHKGLLDLLVQELQLPNVDSIEDFELILYDHKPSCLGGINNEFVFSARLDNLTSCFTSLCALLEASDVDIENESGIRLMACFDHEEIGSSSAQGADSNFLPNILERLTLLKCDDTDVTCPLNRSLILESSAKSFFLSSDVSHGVHPNYSSNYESKHKPALGGGPVIKINANQRYMTNSPGLALVKKLADDVEVPLQLFVVANDSPCGSTIGPILASKTGIRTLDLGNPILSMHSIRETGCAYDLEYQVKLFKSFFEKYSTLENKIIV